jgi:hypothetical protein
MSGEENLIQNGSENLDPIVGKVAGSIFWEISEPLQQGESALPLVPALTYKVKKILTGVPKVGSLSQLEKEELARKIQVRLIPVLFSYEYDPQVVEQVAPRIESAALRALTAV